MVKLNIILYNSLDSEECYSSINNSSNKNSFSILVTNYNQYHGLKLKDSEQFILNLRLMKEAKLRKRKSSITEKQEVLSIEQKVSKLMAEKSMSKFPQYLAANDLKDVYFQEVFDFLGSIEEKKYPSRLEDTLDKEKANWKTTLRNRRNEFIKKLKYENFKRFKLRENPEKRIPQLLMLHTRTEAIKNESLNDEAEEDKLIMIFRFFMKKDSNNIIIGFYRIIPTIQESALIFHKAHLSNQRHLRGRSLADYILKNLFYYWPNMYNNAEEYTRNYIK